MKNVLALVLPFVFALLASCDFGGTITGTVDIQCPLPLPVITDSSATGTFNAACPYRFFDGTDTVLVTPAVF